MHLDATGARRVAVPGLDVSCTTFGPSPTECDRQRSTSPEPGGQVAERSSRDPALWLKVVCGCHRQPSAGPGQRSTHGAARGAAARAVAAFHVLKVLSAPAARGDHVQPVRTSQLGRVRCHRNRAHRCHRLCVGWPCGHALRCAGRLAQGCPSTVRASPRVSMPFGSPDGHEPSRVGMTRRKLVVRSFAVAVAGSSAVVLEAIGPDLANGVVWRRTDRCSSAVAPACPRAESAALLVAAPRPRTTVPRQCGESARSQCWHGSTSGPSTPPHLSPAEPKGTAMEPMTAFARAMQSQHRGPARSALPDAPVHAHREPRPKVDRRSHCGSGCAAARLARHCAGLSSTRQPNAEA